MDQAAASSKDTGPRRGDQPLPTEYRASGGRRLVFSFIFLLLLPFAASLAPMLYQRIVSGQWAGMFGFLLTAIGLIIITTLVGAELMRSLRSRVVLGARSVQMTLPAGHGPTPLLVYGSHDVPYDQIAGVETRCEVYGGWMSPVMLRGCRLLLKDGRMVRLGFVSEHDVDPVFPYPQIAQQIADRAGVEVNDTGNVWRSMPRRMLGIKTPSHPANQIDVDHIDDLNRAHRRFVTAVVVGLVAMIGVGMALDATRGPEGTPLPNLVQKR